MGTIGERIRAERQAQGVSRQDLARFAGIAVSTLSDLELGLSKSTTALHKVARRLHVRPEWLETGKGPKEAQVKTEDEWGDILAYAQQVGLGEGSEAQEYAETHKLKFRTDSLARKRLLGKNLAVMYGKGDSMEPRIHTGDAVLFDQSDTRPRDGHLYVIEVPTLGTANAYSVKRCEIIDEMVFFKADNPRGDHSWRKPRRMDDPRNPIRILGRVRWIGSWED